MLFILADPLHSIFGLELFDDPLGLLHLLYQDFHSLLSLLVNFSKIAVQPAAGQQLRLDNFLVLLQVALVPLSPEPDWLVLILRQGQEGKIIVSLQLVPQAVALIVFVLVHLKSSSIIYSHICHRLPIATLCYNFLWDFLSLAFALMSLQGKHKQG